MWKKTDGVKEAGPWREIYTDLDLEKSLTSVFMKILFCFWHLKRHLKNAFLAVLVTIITNTTAKRHDFHGVQWQLTLQLFLDNWLYILGNISHFSFFEFNFKHSLLSTVPCMLDLTSNPEPALCINAHITYIQGMNACNTCLQNHNNWNIPQTFNRAKHYSKLTLIPVSIPISLEMSLSGHVSASPHLPHLGPGQGGGWRVCQDFG